MNYECKICNFQTDKPSTWYSHLKSKKHVANSEIEENKKQKGNKLVEKIILEKEIENLKNKLNFKEKLIEEKEDKFKRIIEEKEDKFKKILQEKEETIQVIKEKYSDHIETLKMENEFQKEIINEAGGMIKQTMCSANFVINNYKNAPPLKEEKYEEILDDTERFTNNLAYYNKNNMVDERLGDIIIKKFKKDDPCQQSFWSTDSSRQNYIVRHHHNDEKNGQHDLKVIVKNKKENEWTRDKGGIKITKMVIDPLLNNVKKLNDEQINNNNQKITNGKISLKKQQPILDNMIQLSEINTKIKNDTLAKNINKYIAPYFSLNNT